MRRETFLVPAPVTRARVFAMLCLLLLAPLLPGSGAPAARAEEAGAPFIYPAGKSPNADFFGIVGRDPWYEWNTDPIRFPNSVNRDALEGMARDLAYAGAGWVRIEIRAERDDNAPAGPGYIDYRKFDWFIRECAPKYGLKVLLLINSGILEGNGLDASAAFAHLNDAPDRADGTNPYIRQFTARAREIADHYGDAVAAYEILNEPNISATLQTDTAGKQEEIAPERLGALLAEVYGAIKPAHPNVQLVVGGLLYGARQTGGSADFDYLYLLYRTRRVQQYRAASGRFPFDGVAVHAYFAGTPRQVVDHLWKLRGVIVEAGDATGKLWLTEIGVPGTPPALEPGFLAARPTATEAEQARFIRELFPLLLAETRGFVAAAFWFKYEDFPFGSGWAEYGLARLPITARSAYLQPPAPRKPAFAAFQEFANPNAAPGAPESPAGQPADAAYFPETRHAISGAFRQYWEQHGGLARFGFPVTRVFEVGGRRVQYFERARFEYHPENAPPYNVQLGLLTAYLTQGRDFPKAAPSASPPPTPTPTPTRPPGTPGGAPATPTPTATPSPTPAPDPAAVYFPQTGHNLGGAFLDYWRTRGGLASYGYPISEELREVNQADGKTYTVQYFERARFEYHPENQAPYNVLLGLMGLETIATGGWYR